MAATTKIEDVYFGEALVSEDNRTLANVFFGEAIGVYVTTSAKRFPFELILTEV